MTVRRILIAATITGLLWVASWLVPLLWAGRNMACYGPEYPCAQGGQ